MKRLVIVEASGKIDVIRAQLKSIGYPADVIATVGHISHNPDSLRPISLDANLRETAYATKPDRVNLLAKICREASKADQVYLATDDDHEGDVIAYDLSVALAEITDKLWRVRLRALSGSELQHAFDEATQGDFKTAAHNGICRRIVDRAIGATFSMFSNPEKVPVGRVQNALLATLATQPIQAGTYVISAKMADGLTYLAEVPIATRADLTGAEAIAAALREKGVEEFESVVEEPVDGPVASLWGYEEVVAQASLRLRIPLEQAADAFQEAYEKGRVTYPRVRKNGVTPDAIEVALALARHNRCLFDGRQVAVRVVGTNTGYAHEAPRPVDEEMQLGVSLSMLSASDAVAVMVARNIIECGQSVSVKRMRVQIAERDVLFSYAAKPQRRNNWHAQEATVGFTPFGKDVALLRFMAQYDLGRPSTIVSHVKTFLDRGLLHGFDSELTLTVRAKHWLTYGEQCGLTADVSMKIEKMLQGTISDPHKAAEVILRQHGMLESVQEKIFHDAKEEKPDRTSEFTY